MANIYFDLETDSNDPTETKLVLAGFLVDMNPKPSFHTSAKEFLESIENMRKRFDWIRLIGFASSAFDLPIISRDTGDYTHPHEWFHVDLQQIMLPLHGWYFKGNSLLGSLKLLNLTAESYGTGADAGRWARENRMDDLKKHCEADLRNMKTLYEHLRKISWPLSTQITGHPIVPGTA